MPWVFSHFCTRYFYIRYLYTLQHHWSLKGIVFWQLLCIDALVRVAFYLTIRMRCTLHVCTHMIQCHTWFNATHVFVSALCLSHGCHTCVMFKLWMICTVSKAQVPHVSDTRYTHAYFTWNSHPSLPIDWPLIVSQLLLIPCCTIITSYWIGRSNDNS